MTLQLQYLRNIRTETVLKKRLGKLPKDLQIIYDETYNQQLQLIEDEEKLIPEYTFRLLLCSQEPLKTESFLLAVSFCGEERPLESVKTLLPLCFNFVVHDQELDVFRFAHLSVREYLETRDNYKSDLNHALAAECCLRYLSADAIVERVLATDDKEDKVEYLDFKHDYRNLKYDYVNLFHRYACLYWGPHLFESGDYRLKNPLKAISYEFLMDQQTQSRVFTCWGKVACLYLMRHYRIRRKGIRRNRMPDYRMREYYSYNPKYSTGMDMISEHDCIFAVTVWGFCDLLKMRIQNAPTVIDVKNLYSGTTAFGLACKYGNLEAAQMLFDSGAGINISNEYGEAPLHFASRIGQNEIARFLLNKGADVNVQNNSKQTPLHITCKKHDSVELVQILLNKGADVNVRDNSEQTPLHIACKHDSIKLVQILLNKGADVNVRDNSEQTPLHIACEHDSVELVQILLNKGADITYRVLGMKSLYTLRVNTIR